MPLDTLKKVLHAGNQDGDTPLHLLARNERHVDTAQVLLDAGFDVKARNKKVKIRKIPHS